MEIKKLQLGNFGVNCYVVTSGDISFIIDPGAGLDTIEDYLTRNNIDISFIINTHGHYDHIGAVPGILKKYKIPFYIDGDEAGILEDPEKNLSSIFGGNGLSLKTYKIIDRKIKDKLSRLGIDIIKSPGHSPGSMVLIFNGKVIFSGDLLFKGSIGRTDLPGGDLSELKKSLVKLKDLDKRLKVMPGHGPDSTLEEEFEKNFYFQRDFLENY